MSLSFLNPVYLWGLAGLSLPVLVHLLTRRQQTRIRFSAVYLLFQAQKRSIRRSRPNRLLLLFLRCLGVALLCLALANPLFSFESLEGVVSGRPASNVLILDDSYSMAATDEDGTLFDRARATVTALVRSFPAHHHASVVLASDPPRVLQGWTRDMAALEKSLRTLSPSYQTTHIGGALETARDLLAAGPEGEPRVYLVTDLDENGWREESFPSFEGRTFKVDILDLSPFQSEPNLAAVEAVEVSQEFLTNSRMIRVRFRARNWAPSRRLNSWSAALWVNGTRQSGSFLNLPPGESVEHEFSFPHLGKEGLEGYVEIQKDGLPVDNRRLFAYQPDQRIHVLLVDGDPSGVSHQNEIFYVERAMNPFSASVSDIEPVVSTLAELPKYDLSRFSVVALCNVRKLPFDYERELERFVAQGGALLVTLGDQVDPRYYNERLGALLPVSLKSLHQVDRDQDAFQLATEPSGHPVLKVFTGQTLEEMGLIRIHTYYSLEPKPDRPFLVPMRLTNQAPLMTESEFGKGKVLLFASSIDRDWNNFAIQPTFLPWVQRWVKYAAKSLETIAHREALVGEPLVLPPQEGLIYVQTPGGRIHPVAPSESGERHFDQTFERGVYSLYSAPLSSSEPVPADASLDRLPERARLLGRVAVNIDPSESVPGKITPARIQDLLRGLQVRVTQDPAEWRAGGIESGISLVTPLFLLFALVLCVEGWMVRRE